MTEDCEDTRCDDTRRCGDVAEQRDGGAGLREAREADAAPAYVVQILNLNDSKPGEKYDFIIDRTTVLGNPFIMEKGSQQSSTSAERDRVCDEYAALFGKLVDPCAPVPLDMVHCYNTATRRRVLDMLATMVGALREYGIVRLFCWCAPRRCHGETIRDYLLNSV